MNITKYEHACLDITHKTSRLIIDPGSFCTSLTNYNNVSAIVITHVHYDHCDTGTIQKLAAANPSVQIFSTRQVAGTLNQLPIRVVGAGDQATVGDFDLTFWGGQHELYLEYENIAVVVNNRLLHPGDSYTTPSTPFDILAIPASAPWLRVKDAVNYMLACQPKLAFPIHNSLLSEIGEEIHYQHFRTACMNANIMWQVLQPGESIEL